MSIPLQNYSLFRVNLSSLSGWLTDLGRSESFDNIYLDLSKESGKCRFAESGLGWKPGGGGEAVTIDQSNIGGAQWSRAAKGYEVKILQRNSGLTTLDGFQQEVRIGLIPTRRCPNRIHRTMSASARSSKTGTAPILKTRSTLSGVGTGERQSLAKPR